MRQGIPKLRDVTEPDLRPLISPVTTLTKHSLMAIWKQRISSHRHWLTRECCRREPADFPNADEGARPWEKATVARNVTDVIARLPAGRQVDIDVRHEALHHEVEGLRELRQIAGKAQADVASALNIKQPSVSKIENQADMYLSTLRNYVEAIGGQLELVVTLPKRPALRIHRLGEALAHAPERERRRFPSRGGKSRHG
jgi:DNA-binding XRE family transcriptional regulator